MNNPYKISSLILVVVLMFYAARASLQIIEQSGDTGAKMSIVEPQDGVALEMNKFSTSTDETANFGLPVGEAGQDISLTLGEPETPILLGTSDASTDVQDNNSDVIASDPEFVEGESGNPVDEQRDPSPTAQDNNSDVIASEPAARHYQNWCGGVGESGNPVDYKSEEETKDYWVYISIDDRPEVTAGETGGRSKKGDIVDIIPVDRTQGGYTSSNNWLIVKVSGLTQEQISLLMSPWTEDEIIKKEKKNNELIKEETPSKITKAYRKYKINLKTLEAIAGISADKGTFDTELDSSLILPLIEQKTELDVLSYKLQSYKYAYLTIPFQKIKNKFIRPARAATTNNYYVNPGADAGGNGTTSALTGANCAFQSLSLWEDARNGDLVIADTIEVANCAGTVADTTGVTIDGWITGADNYIEIRGDITNNTYNVSKYTIQAHNANDITIKEDFIRIHNLQMIVDTDGGNIARGISIPALTINDVNEIHLYNLIIKGNCSGTEGARGIALADTSIIAKIWNVLIYDIISGTDSDFWGLLLQDQTTTYITNIVVYNCMKGLDRYTSGAVNIYNSVVFETSDDFIGTFNTITYCASDDNDVTAGGVNIDETAGGKTWSDAFTDYTNDDFSLKVSSLLIDAGTNDPLSGYGLTDIDGQTRPYGPAWDIGVDERLRQPRPPASSTGTGPAMY